MIFNETPLTPTGKNTTEGPVKGQSFYDLLPGVLLLALKTILK